MKTDQLPFEAAALIEAALERARISFVAALPERLRAIQRHLDAISKGGDKVKGLEGIRSEVHRIAGTASTVGFLRLGTLSAELDHDLSDLNRKSLTSERLNRLLDKIGATKAEMMAMHYRGSIERL